MRKIVILILCVWIFCPVVVNANEIQMDTEKELFELFEFQEMDRLLEEIFPENKLDFKETILGLINGDVQFTFDLIKKMITDQFFYEFNSSKAGMIHILLIAFIAAIFHNFSSVFQNNQVSELSFYVLYMLLVTISLEGFRVLIDSVSCGIADMLDFLKLLGPIYFLAVAIATGSATSIAFYHLILFTIYIVEMLILNVILPIIQIYVIVRILNEITSEEILSKFAELLQTIIVWSLRTLLAAVFGINVIQGILNPAIDLVKRSILTGGGGSLPVIGNVVEGVTEIVLGTAVLIKNGIGLAGAIVCIGICISPVIQMTIISLMYKIMAALIQPVSDKRMVGCLSSMSDGASLLLRILVTSCTLFLISIAMVAATTS